jgi:cytoskeletal protein CcmA (bactofilin family)
VFANIAASVALVSSAELYRFTLHRAGLSMSLFKRRRDPNNLPATGAGYSVLDAQLAVRGDIETEGTLRIDGRLEGSIRRADIVIIGMGASVTGNISAREVIVGGSVEGNVIATTRIELQPSAVVTGDIDAGAIMVQEGCTIQGRLTVTAPPSAKERPVKVKARAPMPTPAAALSTSGA